MMNFVLAMLKYPDVQRRAQDEIDNVIGKDRLPSFEDKEQLPYVNALCVELLRWQVINPLGVTHVAAEDDVYCGFRIPAGTMIMPNTWAMARDDDLYPDPLNFKPERWLPGGSSFNSLRPEEYVFGYGRRLCPGQVWAEHMIFIAAVSLLAVFNIEKALDLKGNPIPLNEDHKPAIVRLLGPSKCAITPRSEKAASLVRDIAP
ncbi:cytochrome P450 [Schizopora paradoxa]|uniref:Cytochrome P450 n=1 Tax=Schizopora paradoxa TaxID=27342 RepID=A0A0H2RLC7_9AGAM|nr:cytochrome P450 [Schizopora paradoxa]